jgi:hypothetical protein
MAANPGTNYSPSYTVTYVQLESSDVCIECNANDEQERSVFVHKLQYFTNHIRI